MTYDVNVKCMQRRVRFQGPGSGYPTGHRADGWERRAEHQGGFGALEDPAFTGYRLQWTYVHRIREDSFRYIYRYAERRHHTGLSCSLKEGEMTSDRILVHRSYHWLKPIVYSR